MSASDQPRIRVAGVRAIYTHGATGVTIEQDMATGRTRLGACDCVEGSAVDLTAADAAEIAGVLTLAAEFGANFTTEQVPQ